MSKKSKNPPAKTGGTSLYKIPKKYEKNKKLESKQVKDFLRKNLRNTSPVYKKKMVLYIHKFTKVERTIRQAIARARREVEFKRDNRIKYVKKLKNGKKIWLDVKTGKHIKGGKVRDIVFKSTRIKTIEILAEDKKISFDRAKRIYNDRINKRYEEIKKQKQFKDKLKQWKKEGLSKQDIAVRAERLAEGRAELQTIRKVTQSYYYG